MAEIHIFLIIETVLLFGASLTGFISAITIGITRDDFHGCPLYGKLEWKNATHFVIEKFGASSSCSFCVGVQVIAALYALAFAIYHIYVLVKKENKNIWIIPSLLINAGFTIVIFIQACVVSVGFLQWCNNIEDGELVKHCRDGQSFNWNAYNPSPRIDGSSFYDNLKTGESTSWFAFLFWAALLAVSIIRRFRDNRIPEDHTAEERKPVLTPSPPVKT
ncbi:transmembrane protein 179-like [Ptychodera flava]|uniref:transmembrane protein 179-like n=1 Tax=Ptychodera flava TaxID=63121 RepID=UPI00396A19D1